MDTFFAYSHSTVLNDHRFPCQLTDIHDRMFSIGRIISQYRLFVITLDSLYHHDLIFTFLHSLIVNLKTYAKDVRFLIVCPGSKDRLLVNLKKRHHQIEQDDIVDWVVSIKLAKQLQIYRTDDNYYGPFILEVHTTGYWQLIRHIELDGTGLDWLIWSLLATRQECEERARACLKKSQTISVPLVKKQTINKVKVVHWGWTVCPLEIQYNILDQMTIPDVIRCVEALQSHDIIIVTWFFQRLEMHRKELDHFMDLPVKLLDYHERQLSWLLFQWQRFNK